MFLYPALWRAGILGLTPEQMGLYTGATLHEVAHVVGAGNAMGAEIADGRGHRQDDPRDDAGAGTAGHEPGCSPAARGRCGPREGHDPVVRVRFLAVIGFNSLDLLPEAAVAGINSFDTFLLTMAMTGAGGGDQHRKVQTRRRETLPPRRTALPVAAGQEAIC